MDYEIYKAFFNEEGDTAKDWRHTEYVNFCAWVSPEDADKMEQVCIRRAQRWCNTHVNCHVFHEERYTAYNGEIIVSCSCYKDSVYDK